MSEKVYPEKRYSLRDMLLSCPTEALDSKRPGNVVQNAADHTANGASDGAGNGSASSGSNSASHSGIAQMRIGDAARTRLLNGTRRRRLNRRFKVSRFRFTSQQPNLKHETRNLKRLCRTGRLAQAARF